MNEPTQSVTNELRATLWRQVGDATTRKVEDLSGVLVGLAATPGDERLVDRAVQLAHSVAGSAGVYGFRTEARAASSLEGLFRAWTADAAAVAAARELLEVLERGFEVEP